MKIFHWITPLGVHPFVDASGINFDPAMWFALTNGTWASVKQQGLHSYGSNVNGHILISLSMKE